MRCLRILTYFHLVKQKPDLPDPMASGPLSKKVPPTAIASANAKVVEAIEEAEVRKSASRARGNYSFLTPAQKYEVGKRAAEYGVTATIRHYGKKYPDLVLKESSVRRFKNAYQERIKLNLYCLGATGSGKADFSKELPNKKTGCPLATGEELDQQIQHYLTDLRKRGCIVNTSVAIAVGEGILLSKNQSLSTDCLTKDWAKYLFTRMGLVKRKGNTKAKVDVEKFDEIKKLFLQDIRNVIVMDEVPVELVINWDQTGLNYVPVSQWTMAQEGAKRVEIDGKDDKRQITAVFGCSMSGDFLPPQLVYQGKTAKCLPSYQFPSDWNITHTPNHWSNEETMELYVTKVILPYLVDTKRKLKLRLAIQPCCFLTILKDNVLRSC